MIFILNIFINVIIKNNVDVCLVVFLSGFMLYKKVYNSFISGIEYYHQLIRKVLGSKNQIKLKNIKLSLKFLTKVIENKQIHQLIRKNVIQKIK